MSSILNTDVIVLSRTETGDSGFYLKALSPDLGLIDINARGVKKQGAKNSPASQLFACSRMSLSLSKGRYYIDSSTVTKVFYPLRLDIRLFSLASYFAQAIIGLTTENQTARDIYRLLANSLYMLSERGSDPEFIRFIFQMRFMGDIGFLPGLLGCDVCYETHPVMYFSIETGRLFCREHIPADMPLREVSASMVEALRYVCLSPIEKVFNFKLSDRARDALAALSEDYLIYHTERKFDTLDFYKNMSHE